MEDNQLIYNQNQTFLLRTNHAVLQLFLFLIFFHYFIKYLCFFIDLFLFVFYCFRLQTFMHSVSLHRKFNQHAVTKLINHFRPLLQMEKASKAFLKAVVCLATSREDRCTWRLHARRFARQGGE